MYNFVLYCIQVRAFSYGPTKITGLLSFPMYSFGPRLFLHSSKSRLCSCETELLQPLAECTHRLAWQHRCDTAEIMFHHPGSKTKHLQWYNWHGYITGKGHRGGASMRVQRTRGNTCSRHVFLASPSAVLLDLAISILKIPLMVLLFLTENLSVVRM